MILSEKEKIILHTFLNSKEPLSIKELCKLTKIKERTLYREIKNLEQSLLTKNIVLTKEKSKYSLVGDLTKIDNSIIDTTIEQGYSADNKINLIICELLTITETSIKEISEKFYLSYNTIANSLTNIEKILVDYKLKLTRKKGLGINLLGKESDKLILMVAILCNEIKDDDFFTLINSNEHFSANPFVKFLNIEFIQNLYTKNKDLSIFNIYTDFSIKKILISTCLAFENEHKLAYENYRTSATLEEKEYVAALINAAIEISNTNNYKTLENFLLKIVKAAKLIEQVTYFNDKYSYTLIYKITTLIKNVSEKSNVAFTTDKNLISGLIVHVEAAIKRYQLKLVEENNDLQDFVLSNYNELYFIVKSELLNIFKEINFSATELSYIVLHFASSYEQIYRENFVRALVICSSGIGTSKIIGSLIRKNIPEIKNVEYATQSKVSKTIEEDYDIIVSTIKLSEDIDYILVPTILRNEDIVKIREKLLAIRSFKKKKEQVAIEAPKVKKENINIILNNVYFSTQNSNSLTVEGMLQQALEEHNFEKSLVKKMVRRHEKSSVVIPGRNLALFHTLADNLIKPFIIIYNVTSSLLLSNVLAEKEEVKTLFIMVSPNDNQYTELLGQLSVALLDDDTLKEAISLHNQKFIKTKIELILLKYITTNNL